MRCTFGLFALLACVGCGKSGGPSSGAAPVATTSGYVVKIWKPHTSNQYLFRATFPLGDPAQGPAFSGNQPAAAQEGTDFSVQVFTKETGNEKSGCFGIRTARFWKDTKPAAREAAFPTLTGGFPPDLLKSEAKTVTWGGRAARELAWSDPANSTKWVMRHFTTEDGVYIGYIRDLGNLTPFEKNTFFDSFELIPKP